MLSGLISAKPTPSAGRRPAGGREASVASEAVGEALLLIRRNKKCAVIRVAPKQKLCCVHFFVTYPKSSADHGLETILGLSQ